VNVLMQQIRVKNLHINNFNRETFRVVVIMT